MLTRESADLLLGAFSAPVARSPADDIVGLLRRAAAANERGFTPETFDKAVAEGKVKRGRKGRFAEKSATAVLGELDDLTGKIGSLSKFMSEDEREDLDNALDYLKGVRNSRQNMLDAGGVGEVEVESEQYGTLTMAVDFDNEISIAWDDDGIYIPAQDAEEIAGFLDDFADIDLPETDLSADNSILAERATSGGGWKAALWNTGMIEIGPNNDQFGTDDADNFLIDPSNPEDAPRFADALEELAETALKRLAALGLGGERSHERAGMTKERFAELVAQKKIKRGPGGKFAKKASSVVEKLDLDEIAESLRTATAKDRDALTARLQKLKRPELVALATKMPSVAKPTSRTTKQKLIGDMLATVDRRLDREAILRVSNDTGQPKATHEEAEAAFATIAEINKAGKAADARTRIDEITERLKTVEGRDERKKLQDERRTLRRELTDAAPAARPAQGPINSAAMRARLVAEADAEGVRAVLQEQNLSDAQARVLAKDLGVKSAGRSNRDEAIEKIVNYFHPKPDSVPASPRNVEQDKAELDKVLRHSSDPAELQSAAEEWNRLTGGARHQWIEAYGSNYAKMAADNRSTSTALSAAEVADRISRLTSEPEIVDALKGRSVSRLKAIAEEIGLPIHRDMKTPDAIKAHIARSLIAHGYNDNLKPSGGSADPKGLAEGGDALAVTDADLVAQRLQRLRGNAPADDSQLYRSQLRQAKVDLARDRANVLAEIEEVVLLNENDDTASVSKRFNDYVRQRGLGDDPRLTLVAEAIRSGDKNKVRKALRDAAESSGLIRVGGDPERGPEQLLAFDGKRHEGAGGTRPRPGQKVLLVRPGYEAAVDGELVLVEKAVVEGATPEEVRRVEGGTQLQAPQVQSTADRLREMSREQAAQEFDRLPPGARGSLLAELKVKTSGVTNEGKKQRALDALFSQPVAKPATRAASTPSRMTRGDYTRLLKDEHVRLLMLDGMLERDAKAAARPKATIDELKERNKQLRNTLRAKGIDYRTDEQRRADDDEKNQLLDEVERLAVAGGHDGPSKRAGAAKMTTPELKKFITDVKNFQARQADRARVAREGAVARAAREEARNRPGTAQPRQVDYIMDLLARRRRSGEGGGFMVGPTDRAGVARMSEADASAYISSLTGDY